MCNPKTENIISFQEIMKLNLASYSTHIATSLRPTSDKINLLNLILLCILPTSSNNRTITARKSGCHSQITLHLFVNTN